MKNKKETTPKELALKMIDDTIKHFREEDDGGSEHVVHSLAKRLLHHVTEDELFQVRNGNFYIGSQKVSHEEKLILQEEAAALKDSLLWKLMQNELTWLSNMKMFEQARTIDDMLFGKAMLYSQDLQRKFLENLLKK